MENTEDVRKLRTLSVVGYALMVVALVPLAYGSALFSSSLIVIVVQVAAVLLMVWARMTFGSRSFHFAADATKGGLVTSGPYRYVRHPIYSAVGFFVLAGVAANASVLSILLLGVVYLGIGVRIVCEERLVIQEYPEYRGYAQRTKRIIPFLF